MWSDFAIVQEKSRAHGLGFSCLRLNRIVWVIRREFEDERVSIAAGIKPSSAAIVVSGWWVLSILLKVAGAAISG
jgi:hypothetical protein